MQTLHFSPSANHPGQLVSGSWDGSLKLGHGNDGGLACLSSVEPENTHTHRLYNYIIETLSYIIIHELPDATRLVNHKVKGAGSTVVFFRCSIW